MDERLQDKIDQYILGCMSAEDAKAFEDELANDRGLQEQYNFTKMVKETVSEHAELQQMMGDFDEIIKRERFEQVSGNASRAKHEDRLMECCVKRTSEKPAAKPRRRIWIWVSGVAAIIVIGMFVFNPFSGSEQPNFPTQQSDGFPGSNPQQQDEAFGSRSPQQQDEAFGSSSPQQQGSGWDDDDDGQSVPRNGDDFDVIDRLIADKQYAEALAKIESAEHDMERTVYQDKTKKRHEEYGEVENELAEYGGRELQQRRDKLSWLKANALIGLDRREEARPLLNRLRKGNGEYKSRAEHLFKKKFEAEPEE